MKVLVVTKRHHQHKCVCAHICMCVFMYEFMCVYACGNEKKPGGACRGSMDGRDPVA
jgi:hypothetical protein